MTFPGRPSSRANQGRGGDIEFLNAALGSMPYGFSIWDDEFRLILANQRYLDIYRLPADKIRPGVSLEDVIRLTVAAGNHPGKTAAELYPAYRDRLQRTTDPTKPLVHRKSIRDRVIETTHTRYPDLGWVVTHEDVTEPRQQEKVLHQRKLQLDAALDSMLYGFCLWGQDLRLLLCNRRFVELYRLDPLADWSGHSLLDVFLASTEAGNHQGRSAAEMERFYRDGLSAVGENASFVAEEVLVTGRVVKVSFRRTSDDCWVATHEDVTEQKDHLQALHQRERERALQNMRFEAAINNMSQGLCMFDTERQPDRLQQPLCRPLRHGRRI